MKVLFAGLKYDYGILARGESLESKTFVPALKANSKEFFVFWLEENGFPNDLENLQDRLIKYADEVATDVIFFVLMKDELTSETLEYLSSRYITVNWFCDDQWRFEEFTRSIAPKLRVAITTDKYSLTKYRDIGLKNVLLSQWATLDYNELLDLNDVDYKYDVTFVGGKNPTREWIVEELKKKNINVVCFGAGWENGRISFNQMKDIFYASKINLNLSNSVPAELSFLKFILKRLFFSVFVMKSTGYLRGIKTNLRYLKFYLFASKTSEQMKARNFEIPGWGGFQLSQYTLELEDYYCIGSEVAIFNSIEELAKQCKFYLENDDLRAKICINGHYRTRGYNYNNRMKGVLNRLKALKSLGSSSLT